jgi:hypothetical protein
VLTRHPPPPEFEPGISPVLAFFATATSSLEQRAQREPPKQSSIDILSDQRSNHGHQVSEMLRRLDESRPGKPSDPIVVNNDGLRYLLANQQMINLSTETNAAIHRNLGTHSTCLCRRPRTLKWCPFEPLVPQPYTRRTRSYEL